MPARSLLLLFLLVSTSHAGFQEEFDVAKAARPSTLEALTVDVDDLPAGVQWSAKVNDGAGGPDLFLVRDTRDAGRFAITAS